jgi:hypothetical protein
LEHTQPHLSMLDHRQPDDGTLGRTLARSARFRAFASRPTATTANLPSRPTGHRTDGADQRLSAATVAAPRVTRKSRVTLRVIGHATSPGEWERRRMRPEMTPTAEASENDRHPTRSPESIQLGQRAVLTCVHTACGAVVCAGQGNVIADCSAGVTDRHVLGDGRGPSRRASNLVGR